MCPVHRLKDAHSLSRLIQLFAYSSFEHPQHLFPVDISLSPSQTQDPCRLSRQVGGCPGETREGSFKIELDGALLGVDHHPTAAAHLFTISWTVRAVSMSHGHFQIVHGAENFRSFANSCLHDLDERVDHQDEQERREGIAFDDAVREADLTTSFLGPYERLFHRAIVSTISGWTACWKQQSSSSFSGKP